jgi:RimJ/RimL family protein N-acetyltransferase
MEHFTTGRLIVRDWAADDAEAALGIYGREEVTKWLGAPPMRPVTSLAAMREMVGRMIARSADRPDYGLWPAVRRDDGALVGAILLAPVPGGDGGIEIGWHFSPDYWGNGYATEAARGVIGLAFADRGLDRVIAVVYPDNAPSLALCRRLGMTHDGRTDQYYGVWLELFSLIRPE